jgi:hypothetical protein
MHADGGLMPWYSSRCPACGRERSGVFKVGAEARRCDAAVHLVPAQDRPVMMKKLVAPGFRVGGVGVCSGKVY